jgi:hypothetical protein
VIVASIFVIHESHTSNCCAKLLKRTLHMPSTCLGWGHGHPGARGMRIDAGAEIGQNSRVQIGSIGVEISFNALDKLAIYRIGNQSRIFTANPCFWPHGVLVTPPAFEIAGSRLLREFADVGLTDRLADACRRLPKSA